MSKRIIVIEDDGILRDVLVRKLADSGYSVIGAPDGEVGMALIESEAPDLILLDMLLPKKSGLDILAELRTNAELAPIPVIAISNSGEPAEIEKARALGAKDFLIKAVFDANEIINRVNQAFGLSPNITQEVPENAPLPQTQNNMPPQEPPQSPMMPLPEPPQPPMTPTPKPITPASAPQATMIREIADTTPMPPMAPPATPAQPTPTPASTHTPASGANARSVLIVEDDKFLRELAMQKLHAEGFTVQGVFSGQEALTALENFKPNVIILDLILPGMDGYEVLTRLKSNPATSSIPVIVLSNLGQVEDIEHAKKLGAVEFMVKAHFSFGEIVKKINTVLQTVG